MTGPEEPNPLFGASPQDVVLVGAGERARAWLEPLRRSTRLRLVATVTRGEESAAPDLPRHATIDDALRLYPAAALAVALPPRTGLEAALQLATARRLSVVEAPLHYAAVDLELGPGAQYVRIAHGWVTLPGLHAVEALMRRAGSGRLWIEVAGLPEQNHCDLEEALVHASAVLRVLLPGVSASAARCDISGALEVDLTAPSKGAQWIVQLRVIARGQRLNVRVEGPEQSLLWSWENDRESVMLGNRPVIAPRVTPPAAVRALAQLLPDAPRGDGLAEAVTALRLARSCLSCLPTRLPLGSRPLRQAASIAKRRPLDLLARLGLRGQLPSQPNPVAPFPAREGGNLSVPLSVSQRGRGRGSDSTGTVMQPDLGQHPSMVALRLPAEPFELWPFRAGIKPVAFLTVSPEDVERTLAYFGDVHHERRDRRVQIDVQDCWSDKRNEGEARVELYIARDAELARRVSYLQADLDPTRAVREIGTLVGYPPCCVDAFARQDDRANNSRNRYYSHARTLAPDGSTRTPWPWELNNLYAMIIPFYPCSYRCERALEWARVSIGEMARSYPAFVEELRFLLARPVVYFDHDHQLVLDGQYADGWISYDAVALAPGASRQLEALAAVMAPGNRLRLDDRALLVNFDEEVVLRLERTDPALGFVAPFGAVT